MTITLTDAQYIEAWHSTMATVELAEFYQIKSSLFNDHWGRLKNKGLLPRGRRFHARNQLGSRGIAPSDERFDGRPTTRDRLPIHERFSTAEDPLLAALRLHHPELMK